MTDAQNREAVGRRARELSEQTRADLGVHGSGRTWEELPEVRREFYRRIGEALIAIGRNETSNEVANAALADARKWRDFAQRVWDTIPASFDGEDARIHARVLNALGAALRADSPANEERGSSP